MRMYFKGQTGRGVSRSYFFHTTYLCLFCNLPRPSCCSSTEPIATSYVHAD